MDVFVVFFGIKLKVYLFIWKVYEKLREFWEIIIIVFCKVILLCNFDRLWKFVFFVFVMLLLRGIDWFFIVVKWKECLYVNGLWE